MAQTYNQLLKQIQNLQSQADKVRRTEVAGVVERIRHAIEFYALTPADLGFDTGAGTAPVKSRKTAAKSATPAKRRGGGKAKPVRAVKFSNGEGGTWGGLGKRPQWLRDALAQGKALNDFLVKT